MSANQRRDSYSQQSEHPDVFTLDGLLGHWKDQFTQGSWEKRCRMIGVGLAFLPLLLIFGVLACAMSCCKCICFPCEEAFEHMPDSIWNRIEAFSKRWSPNYTSDGSESIV